MSNNQKGKRQCFTSKKKKKKTGHPCKEGGESHPKWDKSNPAMTETLELIDKDTKQKLHVFKK